jgi:putative Mg2+ transporter-C (MgtC) family protein
MPMTIEWTEVALRLALAMLGGALLGINRTERGMAAGLRTTLLVTLAAAVSMIQVNLLLPTVGKTPDSFSVLDLMRLPLGILTGMGFIGAGAILRRGAMVTGITTAATLWLATALGLCFGGGQHGLGLATLGLGVTILWGLKWLESGLKQERRAQLMIALEAGGPSDDDVRSELEAAGYHVARWDETYRRKGDRRGRKIRSEIHWHDTGATHKTPEFVRRFFERQGVQALRWKNL